MKISFTGTQQGMTPTQKVVLERRLRELKATYLIHGGCIGADDEADQIAVSLGIERICYPSTNLEKSIDPAILRARGNIRIYNRQQPLVRNWDIVKNGVYLLACPSQVAEVLRSGTWATVRYARKLRQRDQIEIIRPDVEG